MRIVMTGATAGIGRAAAARLLDTAEARRLIVGARRPTASGDLVALGAEVQPLDLASLDSVRRFADGQINAPPIDALVLNAGLQCASPQTSRDGFELTFAVNHLAHYLLARLLAPHLAANGRIVLTASGTHDPDEKTGMPPPNHADAALLAFPEKDPARDPAALTAGQRAYTASKLCNVMTARELSRRLAATRPDIAVAAFDPGFTPGTGLARSYPGPIGWIFKNVLPLVIRRSGRVSTPANSGGLLADLVLAPRYAHARGAYFAVRGEGRLDETAPSALARDDAQCARLWEDSAGMVGL